PRHSRDRAHPRFERRVRRPPAVQRRPALLPAVRDGPRALPDGPRPVRERHLDAGGGALRPRVSAAAVEAGPPRPARRPSRGHFAMRESDFAGLAELSRLSTLTPQEQARLTPGTAFTAMQTNLAYQDGCLVVWKKNRPEDFKDAENLLRGDRGGFTFEPEVGVHEGLYELDFSSLYPSIMVKYNISAETLDCA